MTDFKKDNLIKDKFSEEPSERIDNLEKNTNLQENIPVSYETQVIREENPIMTNAQEMPEAVQHEAPEDNWRTVYVSKEHKEPTKETYKKEPKYVSRKTFAWTLIFCMILSAAIGAGTYALAISTFGGAVVDKSINTTNYTLAKATGSVLSIQEIINKNENSVVAISTESVSTDSWLGQYVTKGAGSGVIYSQDGYILTNYHVISQANAINVTLNNGKEYPATLVATDPQTDIAVLKINQKGLTPVTLGNMKTLGIGDLAIAIGNPLGKLAGTATEGIISALEREVVIGGKSMTLIQTSASINPGNSGGGLFDQYGNLIGIVVAKSSGSEIEGLGFAIPCDKVATIAKSLIENGYVEGRPAAGITIVDLTDPNRAMQAGVSITGVYIKDVTGKNAQKAGLQKGDLIYYIEDAKVTDSAMLIKEIQNHKIGDKVTFTIVRNNEMIKIKVVLEAAKNITPLQERPIEKVDN